MERAYRNIKTSFLVLLPLFVLASCSLFTQETEVVTNIEWMRIINDQVENRAINIIDFNTDNYLLFGEQKRQDSTQFYIPHIHFISKIGVLDTAKTIVLQDVTFASNAVKTASGQVVFAGLQNDIVNLFEITQDMQVSEKFSGADNNLVPIETYMGNSGNIYVFAINRVAINPQNPANAIMMIFSSNYQLIARHDIPTTVDYHVTDDLIERVDSDYAVEVEEINDSTYFMAYGFSTFNRMMVVRKKQNLADYQIIDEAQAYSATNLDQNFNSSKLMSFKRIATDNKVYFAESFNKNLLVKSTKINNDYYFEKQYNANLGDTLLVSSLEYISSNLLLDEKYSLFSVNNQLRALTTDRLSQIRLYSDVLGDVSSVFGDSQRYSAKDLVQNADGGYTIFGNIILFENFPLIFVMKTTTNVE